MLPPLNHNKLTVTNNYIFILYRRGELCSSVFNLLLIYGRPQVAPTVAYIFSFDKTQAPSDEGAVERSETEGEKAINIKLSLSLPQSFFWNKKMTEGFYKTI